MYMLIYHVNKQPEALSVVCVHAVSFSCPVTQTHHSLFSPLLMITAVSATTKYSHTVLLELYLLILSINTPMEDIAKRGLLLIWFRYSCSPEDESFRLWLSSHSSSNATMRFTFSDFSEMSLQPAY